MIRLLFALFFSLVMSGCNPSVSTTPTPESKSPVSKPRVRPADKTVVERVIKGEACTRYTARRQLELQIRDRMVHHDYASLEKMEQRLHDWQGEELTICRLEDFYDYLADSEKIATPKRLNEWSDHSQSHVIQLLKARRILKQGYELLGTSKRPSATPDVVAALDEQLAKVEAILNKPGLEDCPAFHSTRLDWALLSGKPYQDIEKLLKAGAGYPPCYTLAVMHQTPGWYLPEETANPTFHWQTLLADFPPPSGIEQDAWEKVRMAVVLSYVRSLDVYKISPKIGISWPVLRTSFEALRELEPRSPAVLNDFVFMSVHAKDTPKLQELLPELAGNWDIATFSDYTEYIHALVSANNPQGIPAEIDYLQGTLAEIPGTEQLKEQLLVMGIEDLIVRGRFADVEECGKIIFAEKKQLPSGIELRSLFLEASSCSKFAEDSGWDETFLILRAWREDFPDSGFALAAEAQLTAEYGAKARGGGWAREVSRADMTTFLQRFAAAASLYSEALPLLQDDPCVKSKMAVVLLAGGGSAEEGFQLGFEALEAEPLNQNVISGLTKFSLPRWHGKPGDLRKLSLRILELSPEEHGKMGLAFVAHHSFSQRSDSFLSEVMSWEELNQGYKDLLKHRDTPRIRNLYARHACQAGDMETAKSVFEGLEFEQHSWPDREVFEAFKRWANGGPKPENVWI
jgi:hypothetical protein